MNSFEGRPECFHVKLLLSMTPPGPVVVLRHHVGSMGQLARAGGSNNAQSGRILEQQTPTHVCLGMSSLPWCFSNQISSLASSHCAQCVAMTMHVLVNPGSTCS